MHYQAGVLRTLAAGDNLCRAGHAPQELELKADGAVWCTGLIELIFSKARVRISEHVDTGNDVLPNVHTGMVAEISHN